MTYSVIDDNHFETVENGQKYSIEYQEDKVIAKKVDNNGEIIDEVQLSIGDVENGAKLSKDLLTSLKQMNGSTYFNIEKFGLENINMKPELDYNAYFSNDENNIAMSDELANDEFVLNHELGHYFDLSNNINANEDLLNTFDMERTIFISTNTNKELEQMQYFIDALHSNQGGAITEVIAETNALRSSKTNEPQYVMRSEYLMMHFPKTVAMIIQMLNALES